METKDEFEICKKMEKIPICRKEKEWTSSLILPSIKSSARASLAIIRIYLSSHLCNKWEDVFNSQNRYIACANPNKEIVHANMNSSLTQNG